MTETEYQRLKAKVEREYGPRKELARIAGVPLSDQTLLELWAMAKIVNPLSSADDFARDAMPKRSTER